MCKTDKGAACVCLCACARKCLCACMHAYVSEKDNTIFGTPAALPLLLRCYGNKLRTREWEGERWIERPPRIHTHTHTLTQQTCLHTTFFSLSLTQRLFQPIIQAGTWRVNSCSVSVPQRFNLEPFGLGWNYCALFCRVKCMPAMLNGSLSLWNHFKNSVPPHTCRVAYFYWITCC